MSFVVGADRPWLGLVEAFGVLLVLLAWNAARARGPEDPRVPMWAGGAGALLLVVVMAGFANRAGNYAHDLTFLGFDHDGGRRAFDIVLGIGGIAAGWFAVRWVRLARWRSFDDYEDEVEPTRPPAWANPLAVAVALSLPIGLAFVTSGYYRSQAGDVTVLVVCLRALVGVIHGGALLAVIQPDDDVEMPVVLGAFALVAAGDVIRGAWLEQVSNEFWVFLATGLAIGLLVAAAGPLLGQVLVRERTYVGTGMLVAVALLVLSGVLTAKTSAERLDRTPDLPLPTFDPIYVPTLPAVPTVPELPPLPTFP